MKNRIVFAWLMICMLLTCTAFADGETTKAMDDGYYRLPFENGYYGFGIAYGTPNAEKDDIYRIYPTDQAINSYTGENIGNYLKVFATQYPDIFLDDGIRAQHYIWHFSDDFMGWRIDLKVVEEIRKLSRTLMIPDHGYTQQIGNTLRTWDFIVLDEEDGNALFFAYKYTDTEAEPPSSDTAPLPETGDRESLVLWCALAVISAAGTAIVLLKRRAA